MKQSTSLTLAAYFVLGVSNASAQATVAPDESHAWMHTATYANPPAAEQRRRVSRSVSVGSTNRGRLSNGVRLSESATIRIKPSSLNSRWGTAEMVGLIERAAAHVSIARPGARLTVGDISGRNGGRLRPHRSHRSGRDADVGFYLKDADGNPVELDRFVDMAPDGCGEYNEVRYCFDDERNWELIAAMVQDPIARVQYILVTPYVQERLLAAGTRLGAAPELVARVALATERHRGSSVHRNHFHVRVYCAVDDRPECSDMPPYHPWYEGTPPVPGEARPARRPVRNRAHLRGSGARRGRTR